MRKMLISMLALGLLAGCSSKVDKKEEKSKSEQKENTQQPTAKKEASKYPFPAQTTQTGNAKFTISTASGSSEGGQIPVLFIKPDTLITQIGADLENFQGDKQTFLYIDKIFKTTEQAGQMTQATIDLQGDSLKPGVHTVTAVQFENDDPAAGKVINFVAAKYEVKESK